MSLDAKERRDTIQELRQNFDLLGASIETVAQDLQTSPAYIRAILALDDVVMEDPWILRKYLNAQLLKMGTKPIPYSKLVGDYHDYWFLDVGKIDRMEMSH